MTSTSEAARKSHADTARQAFARVKSMGGAVYEEALAGGLERMLANLSDGEAGGSLAAGQGQAGGRRCRARSVE